MTTLKEAIEKKFEFDTNSYNLFIMEYAAKNGHGPRPLELSQWQHEQLKSEVLPILLECVEALEKIANEDFRGNRPQSSVDAYKTLEWLRKWSEK